MNGQHVMTKLCFERPPVAEPDDNGDPWIIATVVCSCGWEWCAGKYGIDVAAAAAESFWDRGHASMQSVPVQASLFAGRVA